MVIMKFGLKALLMDSRLLNLLLALKRIVCLAYENYTSTNYYLAWWICRKYPIMTLRELVLSFNLSAYGCIEKHNLTVISTSRPSGCVYLNDII